MALSETSLFRIWQYALRQRSLLSLPATSSSSILSTTSASSLSSLQQVIPLSMTIPAISINVPGIILDLWEGLLRAVPKKKTSHMKKRHRQLAGKALKDVTNVVNCPGCGKPKRAHFVCPYCIAELKEYWKRSVKQAVRAAADPASSTSTTSLEQTTEAKQSAPS